MYTRGKLKRAYTYSDTMKHLTMYARFVNNNQKGLCIYVYSNLLKNWSLVHNIPYYRPEPIVLADGMDEIKPQSDGTFVVNGGNNITT